SSGCLPWQPDHTGQTPPESAKTTPLLHHTMGRDPWFSSVARGALPTAPKTDSLETAAAAIADRLRIAEEALVRLTAEAVRRRRSVDLPPRVRWGDWGLGEELRKGCFYRDDERGRSADRRKHG